MVEEAIRLLQLVEIRSHLVRVPVEIHLVAGGAIRFQLQNRQHIHVVDPVARLVRQAVGLRIDPLPVGKRLPVVEILLVLGFHPDLQRNNAEDGVIHVVALGNLVGLGAARHQRIEFFDQPVAQVVVARQLSEGQRSVPSTDLTVKNGPLALVRAGDEVLGQPLAHLLRRIPRRPVAEEVLLRRRGSGCRGQ